LDFDLSSESGQEGVVFRGVEAGAELGLEISGAVPSAEKGGTAGDPDETVERVGVTAFFALVDSENGLGAG